MIPSRLVYLLLSLGIAIAIFVAILKNLQIAVVVVLIYDAVVLLLGVIDALRVKANRVEIKRHHTERLSVGRDNRVTLSLRSSKTPASVLIKDYYPLQFNVPQSTLQQTLASNTSEELTYTVYPNSRGEFLWGNIQVRQLGPWGLGWYDWQVSAQQKVAVYPDLIGLRSLSIRLALENTGSMRQAKRLGTGTEFSELREYSTGDDTRLIDWKATARRSRPLVRVLEPEKEQTLIILLDRGRLMTAQVQGLTRFDWGLNATLSLALAGLNRGDRVGVGVFDREVTTWIPPERGQNHLPKLIERLTPIQPVLLEPDYMGAITKLVNQQTRRALVVLITDIVDTTASAELLASLMRLTPRYLPLCVTLRDPQVDVIAHTANTIENKQQGKVETAYSRAVALDLLSQREVAFAQLKQKGVLVLDAPANQISEELVEQYLRLKARNLL
ncbi:MAG: DUF58 domain-containing protein [Spirulinaceae cyanobacterium]